MTWDGTGVDPWLPHRIAAEIDIASAERRMFNAWWGSFSDWLVQVNRAVLAGDPPDPNGVWSEAPDWQDRMAEFVEGPVKDTVGLAYQRLFGVGYQFDQRPAVTAHLSQVSNRMVRTPADVYDTVAAAIARGAGAGESIPKITDRVDHILSARNVEQWRGRAVTVSRTETLGALNAGRADAHAAVAEELGGEFENVWLATLDARVRRDHLAADGQRVPVGTPFTVGGEHLLYPGDPAGSAAQTVNCRCTTLLERPGERTDMTGRGFTDADAWWDSITKPAAAESTPYHGDLSEVADLKAAVDSGPPKRKKLSGGSVAPVYRDTFPNGTSLVEKTSRNYRDDDMKYTAADQADAENLASQLGRALNARVPRVYQTAANKVYMDVAPGETYTMRQALIYHAGGRDMNANLTKLDRLRDAAFESDAGRRLGLLDALTDNWDRNNGNWTLDELNNPIGFDHGFAWDKSAVSGKRFGADYADQPPSPKVLIDKIGGQKIEPFLANYGVPSPFAQHLWWVNPQGKTAWVANDFTPADMDLARIRLAALKPEFERLGRGDWHEFARRRLEAIAAHATGTRNRIA